MTDMNSDYWDKHAKNYDYSMALLGGPMPRMIELVGEAVRGATRVLEVAAGTGLVTTTLAACAQDVVATDYSVPMLARLKERIRDEGLQNVRCEHADIYALRFDPETFDAVVATNVLHIVPDTQAALVALRRVLRPGGRMVVPAYCHDETALSWMVSRVLAVTGFPGYRRFTFRGLREAVEESGFRISRSEMLPGLIPIGYVEGTIEA